MQRLEVSGAVRPIYGSLGVKRLMNYTVLLYKRETVGINCVSHYPYGIFILRGDGILKTAKIKFDVCWTVHHCDN